MKLNITQTKGFQKASEVKVPEGYFDKIDSGSKLLNEVLGGGWVKGTSICLYAKAGTGKTSLMLGALQFLCDDGLETGYVSGEESIEQLSNTCKRINVSDVNLANLTNIDDICQLIVDENINFLVIDSIPSLTTSIKMNKKEKEEYIINKIVSTAKETSCIILCILHQTKEGKFLGGTGIIHAVDIELKLSNSYKHSKSPKDEMPDGKRYFSSIKNRFGSPCGVELTMTNTGFDLNPQPVMITQHYYSYSTPNNVVCKKYKKPNAILSAIGSLFHTLHNM